MTFLNKNMVFSLVFLTILLLVNTGCAVKEADTTAEKVGKHIVNSPIYAIGLINAGATLLMAPIIMPVGGIIKGFKNIDDGDYGSAVVIEDVNKSLFDTNSSYELLTQSNGVYFYSAQGLPENKFIVVMECDDNKTMAMEADGMYIASNYGNAEKGFCKRVDNLKRSNVLHSTFSEEKFYTNTEKDRFGKNRWSGNDLLLCVNCKEPVGKRISYLKDARAQNNILVGAEENIKLSTTYIYPKDVYTKNVVYIEDSESLSDNGYVRLLNKDKLTLFKKTDGSSEDSFFLLDERTEKKYLIEMSKKNIEVEAVRARAKHLEWFDIRYCSFKNIDMNALRNDVFVKDDFGNDLLFMGGLILSAKETGIFTTTHLIKVALADSNGWSDKCDEIQTKFKK